MLSSLVEQHQLNTNNKVKVAVDTLGAERVMSASGGAFDAQLGVIYDSEITEQQRQQVLYSTAKEVFGF